MSFESLANELLLDLFEYFDGVPLLRAFHGLNSRLDCLLFTHFRAYHLDFRSISKHDFNLLCKFYLPLLLDRTTSLILSDEDETPDQSELFLSSGYTLDQFVRLQSLSLYSIQFISFCHQLPSLTYLNISNTHADGNKKNTEDLINHIWSLLSLKQLRINDTSTGKLWLSKLSIISSSIRKLSIENITCTLQNLSHLFRHTPYLQYLNTTVHFDIKDEEIPLVTSSISSLKLTFESSVPVLVKLFQMLPNLSSLKLKTLSIYLSGNKWKRILVNHCVKIRLFQLRMYFEFPHRKSLDEELDKIVNSYRTPFWLEHHRWFIRCDCIPFGTYYHGLLYTLPYSFDSYVAHDTIKSAYTCPDNERECFSSDRVNHLRYTRFKSDSSNAVSMQFPNVYELTIGIPFDEQFWSFIPSFHRLQSLVVFSTENESHSQLQALLHSASHLYSLQYLYSGHINQSFTQLSSSSVRRLSFLTKSSSNPRYFNELECQTLAQSQLGRQCEVLLIEVHQRKSIVDLIRTMTNLRALIVQCEDDGWTRSGTDSLENELIQWLRCCLPSTYSITRDKRQPLNVRIWIDRKKDNVTHVLD